MIKRICYVCENKFLAKTKRSKYCSNKCKSIQSIKVSKKRGYRKQYFLECKLCGKKFNPVKKNQRFCSRGCAVRGRIGKTKRSSKFNNTQCFECGKPIYRKPYLLKKSKRHFCSTHCSGRSKQVLNLKENNPNYKAAGIRKCIACGNEYVSYQKNRRYCSLVCSAAAQQSEAMANLKRGYRAELKCCNELKKRGYHTTRSAASKGEYDVIAINNKEILLIQVKCTKGREIAPPRVLKKLKEAIAPTSKNIKKQLWVWIERRGWNIINV